MDSAASELTCGETSQYSVKTLGQNRSFAIDSIPKHFETEDGYGDKYGNILSL